MTAAELLAELTRRNVTVSVREGGVLNFEPRDAVGAELEAAIRARKDEMLTLLTSNGLPPAYEELRAVLDGLGLRPEPARLEAALRGIAARLNGADPLVREVCRAELVARLETLGVRAPARVVDAALGGRPTDEDADTQGQELSLAGPVPWPTAVEGAALLDAIAATFTRFVSLPPGSADALALLVMNAHAHDAAEVSPMALLTSPTKRCGKTTTLEIVKALVPRAAFASNITPAALFRTIEAYAPTLLIDEADTFVAQSDELRGLLNAGHTRATAYVIRTVGDDHTPRRFSTWCPKFVAAIGRLRDTLEDRAVLIAMRRRAPGERLERVRRARLARDLEPLCRQAARWTRDHIDALRDADPAVPDALNDRAADNWRLAFGIADAAGGTWPERARRAALTLAGAAVADGETAAGVMLLEDLHDLFEKARTDRLPTARIIDELCAREERPWPEWNLGKPITPPALAKLLRPFGARPGSVRDGAETFKGYKRADLEDAFSRYITASQPSQPAQLINDADLDANGQPSQAPFVTAAPCAVTSENQRIVTVVTATEPLGDGWDEE